MTGPDEFYIGWEDKQPAAVASRVFRMIALLVVAGLAFAVILAGVQHTIGVSVFEWGNVKSFSGILKSQPYPHLLVPRPRANGAGAAFSTYHLVQPFKFGLDATKAAELDGSTVSLRGTLIYREGQTMIEVVPDSIKRAEALAKGSPDIQLASRESFGEQTLTGEIVDSKCYLGVMNPGALTPHRACAIRCISGGIPPVLLVRQTNRPALYFLLVSRDGKPVNKEVLNLVAEPVQITGEVERQEELLILRADPATYRRVKR